LDVVAVRKQYSSMLMTMACMISSHCGSDFAVLQVFATAAEVMCKSIL